MDGSNGGSNSPAPFLVKTYEMVDDPLTNSIVSWSHTGLSFVVWNPQDFASDLLPKYFKHGNFSSFIRQLNTYGFRKIDPDQWEFANEEFIRGHVHLLKNIHRRKPIHSHSNSAAPLTNSEEEEFKKDIEKLKRENLLLQLEADRHKQENQEYASQLYSLQQMLQDIDHRQRQLILAMSQLLHKQGCPSSVVDISESFSKKRRLLTLDCQEDDDLMQENQSLISHERISNTMIPLSNSELVEKFDSSLTFWERLVDGVDQNYVVVPEIPSSACIDLGSSEHMLLEENEVSLNRTEIFDDEMSRNLEKGGYIPFDANDIFWEQFLTEAPEPFTSRLGG